MSLNHGSVIFPLDVRTGTQSSVVGENDRGALLQILSISFRLGQSSSGLQSVSHTFGLVDSYTVNI